MAYYGVKGFLLDKDHICESVKTARLQSRLEYLRISQIIRWIVMKFHIDVDGTQRMSPNDFGPQLTFLLATYWAWQFLSWVKCINH